LLKNIHDELLSTIKKAFKKKKKKKRKEGRKEKKKKKKKIKTHNIQLLSLTACFVSGLQRRVFPSSG